MNKNLKKKLIFNPKVTINLTIWVKNRKNIQFGCLQFLFFCYSFFFICFFHPISSPTLTTLFSWFPSLCLFFLCCCFLSFYSILFFMLFPIDGVLCFCIVVFVLFERELFCVVRLLLFLLLCDLFYLIEIFSQRENYFS